MSEQTIRWLNEELRLRNNRVQRYSQGLSFHAGDKRLVAKVQLELDAEIAIVTDIEKFLWQCSIV